MQRFWLLTFSACWAAWSLSASAQVTTNPFPMPLGGDPLGVQPETQSEVPDLSVQYVFPEDSKIDLKTLGSRVEKLKKLTMPDAGDDYIVALQRARLNAALLFKTTIDDFLSTSYSSPSQLFEMLNLAHERIAEAGMELVQTESEPIELLALIRDSNAATELMLRQRARMGAGGTLELRKMQCDLLDAELKLALAKRAIRQSPKQSTQR